MLKFSYVSNICFVAKAECEAAAEASGVQGLISESVEQRKLCGHHAENMWTWSYGLTSFGNYLGQPIRE